MSGEEQFKERSFGVGEGSGDGSGFSRKNYLRSASWTDRSPRKSTLRPQSNNKARLGISSLPPLSISKRTVEEWPRAGSDDLGVWPQAPTPGVRGPPKLPRNLEFKEPEREFEFKKDQLAVFDKDCSRIIDHVYLGSDAVAKNLEVLRENRITHVLNCVGFVCPEYFQDDFGYKTLWLRDSPTEDITSILYDVFDYFEDVREQGGRVLVHCCQGVSRSTSLVIAYIMWREKKSFEDALQYVKAVRGVTNPNMGFACQLMLRQNQALAILASPDSVFRMYRMAPHSPYDPLHLVPKMLSKPGIRGLDSRGAFVIHAPVAVYVWIGKDCVSLMSDSAKSAAHQVVRYELVQGPVIIVEEGQEPDSFREALSHKQSSSETIEEETENSSDEDELSTWFGLSEKKVDIYNQDFEIFHRALMGGVVPPFPLSGTVSETHLPARESGWGRLRRKFSSGIVKELIMSAKLFPNHSPSNNGSDTMDFSRYSSSSPNWAKDTCNEGEHADPQSDTLCSPTHSSSSQDSFSSYLINSSPKSETKSPVLSPTTSDYSSSFTFSPSSSKWSEFSSLSCQTSPSSLESPHPCPTNDEQNDCLSSMKASSGDHVHKETDDKGNTNSVARGKGGNLVPLMMLPSIDEVSQAPKNLVRSWSFSLSNLGEDVDMSDASDEVQGRFEVENS